jgi:hypothetical protein
LLLGLGNSCDRQSLIELGTHRCTSTTCFNTHAYSKAPYADNHCIKINLLQVQKLSFPSGKTSTLELDLV